MKKEFVQVKLYLYNIAHFTICKVAIYSMGFLGNHTIYCNLILISCVFLILYLHNSIFLCAFVELHYRFYSKLHNTQ